MLDRLLHRSIVINLDGESYRLRDHHAAAETLRRTTTGTDMFFCDVPTVMECLRGCGGCWRVFSRRWVLVVSVAGRTVRP